MRCCCHVAPISITFALWMCAFWFGFASMLNRPPSSDLSFSGPDVLYIATSCWVASMQTGVAVRAAVPDNGTATATVTADSSVGVADTYAVSSSSSSWCFDVSLSVSNVCYRNTNGGPIAPLNPSPGPKCQRCKYMCI